MPPTVAPAPVQPTDGDGRRRGIIAHWRSGAAYELSRPGSPRRWVSVSHSALHIRSRRSDFLNPILTIERRHSTRVLYAPRLRKPEEMPQIVRAVNRPVNFELGRALRCPPGTQATEAKTRNQLRLVPAACRRTFPVEPRTSYLNQLRCFQTWKCSRSLATRTDVKIALASANIASAE
jgi:hypothetical protein